MYLEASLAERSLSAGWRVCTWTSDGFFLSTACTVHPTLWQQLMLSCKTTWQKKALEASSNHEFHVAHIFCSCYGMLWEIFTFKRTQCGLRKQQAFHDFHVIATPKWMETIPPCNILAADVSHPTIFLGHLMRISFHPCSLHPMACTDSVGDDGLGDCNGRRLTAVYYLNKGITHSRSTCYNYSP